MLCIEDWLSLGITKTCWCQVASTISLMSITAEVFQFMCVRRYWYDSSELVWSSENMWAETDSVDNEHVVRNAAFRSYHERNISRFFTSFLDWFTITTEESIDTWSAFASNRANFLAAERVFTEEFTVVALSDIVDDFNLYFVLVSLRRLGQACLLLWWVLIEYFVRL